MDILKMAWRNVWRNRRRTVVTVAAMSLALFVMIQYSGLVEGYLAGMERNILDLELGDMQVFAKGYLDNPSLYTRIDNPETLVRRFRDADYLAAARLLAGGLAAAEETSAGVTLRGIHVMDDARVSRIHEHMLEGTWLDPQIPSGVVLGRRLAHTLDVRPGDSVVVLTQGADGSIANDLYTVRGILKNMGEGVDRTGIFMTARAFRELMVLPEGAHQIVLRRPTGQDLEAAAEEARRMATGLDVRTWRDLVPTLATMLDSAQAVMYTMFFIFYISVGIVVLNAMLMAVFERIREFGVLKALGVGPGGVLTLIFTESLIQTCLALIVGGLASVPVCWYLATRGINLSGLAGIAISGIAWDPVWRSVIDTGTLMRPVWTLVVVVFLAAVYPALKAAMIRPMEAIHHR